jgi:exopolysaccharide biosynthesis polyprenyl glycosylphosphotransferase
LLFVRYGEFSIFDTVFLIHVTPFTIAIFAWIILFYIGGLYENFAFKNTLFFKRRFFTILGLCGVFLIMMLYFVPQFGIAPKINFFIFMGIFAVSEYAWRFSFNTLLKWRSGSTKIKLLLIGDSDATRDITEYTVNNPQLGYVIAMRLKNAIDFTHEQKTDFIDELIKKDISLIIIPALQNDPRILRVLYSAFLSGIEVVRLTDFYEQIFEKIPVAELDEAWLLQNLPRNDVSFQAFGRLLEGILAFALLIVFLPIMILCAIAIALTSRGPILYSQKRVGQYEEIFNLYKFRSMYADARNPDADSKTAIWSTPDDARTTPIGRILRASHLDELPQLWNIVNGTMSIVGPRPERPEFTAELEAKIPYYELRYLKKPGIAGWAQLNYRYGASVEDAYKKLQYDIYYLKNSSFALNLKILVKTMKKFFV